MITWDTMMFFIYIFGIVMCLYLMREPPDWMQTIVLCWGIVGMLLLVLYHGLEAFSGYDTPWQVRSHGLSGCTMAFVFHVARLMLIKAKVLKCRNSLRALHNSPG